MYNKIGNSAENASELRVRAYKFCSVTDSFRLPLKSSE